MNESKFDFRETYNAFEDLIVQMLKDHIDLVKKNKDILSSEDLLIFIQSNRKDLQSNLSDELSKFASVCIDSTEEERIINARTLDPIFLKHYVMSLHNARMSQLLVHYDYDSGVILGT